LVLDAIFVEKIHKWCMVHLTDVSRPRLAAKPKHRTHHLDKWLLNKPAG
jgi:hypothetical protein